MDKVETLSIRNKSQAVVVEEIRIALHFRAAKLRSTSPSDRLYEYDRDRADECDYLYDVLGEALNTSVYRQQELAAGGRDE